MLGAIGKLDRYIALSIVAVEHRPSIYAYVSSDIWPAASLQVFAFADDYSMGILHSMLHRKWFDERCSTMRRDPRYTPNTVFDSLPWPQAPTNEDVKEVVSCVEAIMAFREDRLVEGITLGQQYDSFGDPGRNPLRDLHQELDRAVTTAYGFDPNEDALAQLFALNASVAAEEHEGVTRPRGPGDQGLVGTRRTTQMIRP